MISAKKQSSPSSHSGWCPSSSSLFALAWAVLLGLLLLLPPAMEAFEFDLPNDHPARQFGPSQGGPAAGQRALFADAESNLEDTAGFVSGFPVSSARRRLIQPPPLKRAALEAQRMDWLLAGLRPRAE